MTESTDCPREHCYEQPHHAGHSQTLSRVLALSFALENVDSDRRVPLKKAPCISRRSSVMVLTLDVEFDAGSTSESGARCSWTRSRRGSQAYKVPIVCRQCPMRVTCQVSITAQQALQFEASTAVLDHFALCCWVTKARSICRSADCSESKHSPGP